jgi:hypothetical protein
MARGRPRKAASPASEAATSTPAATRSRTNNKPQVPFPFKLVLNQWLLGMFGVQRLEQLAEHLRQEGLEGMDENNVHRFHHALTAQLFNLTYLPTELLLEYDQNIVRHTQKLNDRRLEILPVSRVALHRGLPRLVLLEAGRASQCPERANRQVQRGQARGRPDRQS